MIARPERISIVVYLITVFLIGISVVLHMSSESLTFTSVVVPLLFIVFVICSAGLFLHNLKPFLVVVLLHVGIVVILLFALDVQYPLISVIAVTTLILNVVLRLPVRFSVPILLAVVMAQLSIFLARQYPLADTLILAAIEGIILFFAEEVIYYREALVVNRTQLSAEHQSVENLTAANDSFVQNLPEMKEESAEQERLRITRELHDSIGYSMTNITMIMNAAQYLHEKDPGKVRDYCVRAKELASTTMAETRATLYKLRALGRTSPMNPAIFFHKLCLDFQEATAVQTECHTGNMTQALPNRVFEIILRTIQVGFINALKHGKTTRIHLYFWIGEDELRVTIWNSIDEREYVQDPVKEGIGLSGVRERIAEIDGRMDLEYVQDGFKLEIFIPAKELDDGINNSSDS